MKTMYKLFHPDEVHVWNCKINELKNISNYTLLGFLMMNTPMQFNLKMKFVDKIILFVEELQNILFPCIHKPLHQILRFIYPI